MRLAALLLALVACDPAHLGECAAGLTGSVPLPIDPSAAHAEPNGPVFDGGVWHLGGEGRILRYPVPVQAGDRVVEWLVTLRRDVDGAMTRAVLEKLDPVTLLHVPLGPVAEGNGAPGYVSIAQVLAAPHPVTDDETVSLRVVGGLGKQGDRAGPVIVYVERALP